MNKKMIFGIIINISIKKLTTVKMSLTSKNKERNQIHMIVILAIHHQRVIKNLQKKLKPKKSIKKRNNAHFQNLNVCTFMTS